MRIHAQLLSGDWIVYNIPSEYFLEVVNWLKKLSCVQKVEVD